MKGCGVAPNLGSCQLESALRVLSGSRAHCTCAAACAACVQQHLWFIWPFRHADPLGTLCLQLRKFHSLFGIILRTMNAIEAAGEPSASCKEWFICIRMM